VWSRTDHSAVVSRRIGDPYITDVYFHRSRHRCKGARPGHQLRLLWPREQKLEFHDSSRIGFRSSFRTSSAVARFMAESIEGGTFAAPKHSEVGSRVGCQGLNEINGGTDLPSQKSMIRKVKSGYRLYSRKKNPKTGKRRNLGTFKTRAAAKKHERAVQFFKRR
jgi:hypothetical protein